MSTYYKYVDRDVDQQINWADVGGQISKSLLDRQADLAKQKAAINKDSTELLSQLNNPELGTNRDINTLMIDGGMKLAQTQKSLNTLFNKRLLSQSEYLQATQNIKTNADTFSKLAKQWNEASAAGYQAVKDGKASLASYSNFDYVQQNFDPNKIGIVVDDKGNLFLGNKVVKNIDGVDVISVEAKPGALQSVNNYSALLKTGIVPKYDIESFAKSFEVEKQKYVKILSEKDPTIFDKGEQFIVDSLKNNPDFMDAIKTATLATVENPQSTISILFDGAGSVDGKPYEVDFTGEKEGDNIIKARVTPTGIAYDFTDRQKARAQEVLLQRILGKVSYEEKKNIISEKEDVATKRAKAQAEIEQSKASTAKTRQDIALLRNNSTTLGQYAGKLVRPTSGQEAQDAAQSFALAAGFNKGTYSAQNGGIITFEGKDDKGNTTTTVVNLAGKNARSSVQDLMSTVRSVVGDKNIDYSIAESSALNVVKKNSPRSYQSKFPKRMKGF